MREIASFIARFVSLSCFDAVDTMPMPSGLVRTSTSPGRAPAFDTMRSGCTVPVTLRP